MALTVDTPRAYELGDINSVPVKASTKIYEGAAVGLTAGYARGLVAGDDFVGFAERQADNSAVAVDGNINCRVISKGILTLTITGVAVTHVGQPVYASADGTFTLTQSTNSYIGNVYRFVAANTAQVAFIAKSTNDGPAAAGDSLAAAQILVGNAAGVAAARAVTGDVTINNSGAVAIGAAKILTAMISNSQITWAQLATSTLSSIVSVAASTITSQYRAARTKRGIMKVVHWSSKNGSGMHRMAEEITAAEAAGGLNSVCLDGNDPLEIPGGLDADIHVVHTHLPDAVDDRKIKKVYVVHGTPETMFQGSVENSKNGHGSADGWMVNTNFLRTSDAIVTFWQRHAAIWQSLVDKHTIVDCIPMGIDHTKWQGGQSRGKWSGEPSLLTAENCHTIKWPLDLVIALTWVFEEIRTARLHMIYLPADQARWWGSLTMNNRTAYRSYISSIALDHAELANAFKSVDYYVGLVRYGDHNRVGLEAHAAGCKVIAYRGNEYADYWIDEGDQRTIAAQLKMIMRGDVPARETPATPDISETIRAMKKIYERIL